MTDTKTKIREVRSQIRSLGLELNQLNLIQRKTSLILVSIERYTHERMMQAIVEFEKTSEKINEVNKKMKKKFDELYILNVEYSKPELTA
jgi:conjugal transfer/entry exclusion protein